MLMPTSGAEKKSVLVRWMEVRLNAKRTALSVVGLMHPVLADREGLGQIVPASDARHEQVLLGGRKTRTAAA